MNRPNAKVSRQIHWCEEPADSSYSEDEIARGVAIQTIYCRVCGMRSASAAAGAAAVRGSAATAAEAVSSAADATRSNVGVGVLYDVEGCCDCFELHDIVMQHRKEPEVITLSDGDEQESQDLFDSPEEQEVIECIDSDDLFSSPEVVEGNTNGRRISYRSPDSSARCGLMNGTPTLKDRRSSFVTISTLKSKSPLIRWRRKKSHTQPPKRCSTSPMQMKTSPSQLKATSFPLDSAKNDIWTKTRLGEIARKFEERGRLMSELVSNDKDFLDMVQGGAVDLVQKKAKEDLVEGAVIRNRADRARMIGVECASSKAYFDALELSPESRERRINEVSRVRVVGQKMPGTPENYWEVGFPSESEQKRRGLIKEVSKKSSRKLFQNHDVDCR